MKRTTTILIAICVSALFANGKQISQNAALSAARKYSRTGQVAPAKNLRSDKTNNAPYYAFNLEQGYVIVSGDDEMTELVGYAENGFFDAENVPPQMQLWVSRNLVGINFRHPNVMPNFAVWKTITYRLWHRWCCQPRF